MEILKSAEITDKTEGSSLISLFSLWDGMVRALCPVLRPEKSLLGSPKLGGFNMNIGQFRKYCTKNFNMGTWGGKIQDKRRRPEIPAGEIFESISYMPVLGQRSLLELDEFSRTPEARKWYGTDRDMVASDTTVERVAGGFMRQSIQDIGYEMIDSADQEALWDLKLPSGKKLRFGIVDGHWAGGLWASVLAVSGKTDGVVDLERYPGRGHELSATRRLLKRAFRKLGKGFFGIVAGDGLYATKEDFELCLDHGSHLLVKTDEEGLAAIQDACYLFRCEDGLHLEGSDAKRHMEYEVTWTEGIEWQGLSLTVAHVEEHHLRPAKDEPEDIEFWVLTTATGFTGEDLRELAHLRWEIENNIFKRLNHLVGSKRPWSHKPKVMEMLLRIWMIGLTLLGAYLFQEGWICFKQTWESVKKTWRAVTRLMKRSLLLLAT